MQGLIQMSLGLWCTHWLPAAVIISSAPPKLPVLPDLEMSCEGQYILRQGTSALGRSQICSKTSVTIRPAELYQTQEWLVWEEINDFGYITRHFTVHCKTWEYVLI